MSLFDDLNALLSVQAVDSKILRAQAALAGLDTGAALAAAYNTQKADAERLRTAATKALAEQHDAEMRLQSIEDKTAQVQKTLFSGTVTGARELENLQKETEMLGRQRGDAETRVLEAMEIATEQTARAERAEKTLSETANQYRTVRAAFKERHALLSGDLAVLDRERKAAAESVPPALLARYDAIRAKKSGIGAARCEDDGTCGACHTLLNTNLADAVKAAATIEICDQCGRILVPATHPE